VADPWRYWAITHADLPIMNPLSQTTLDRAIERMALPPGARVLDIACGKGELLIRLARR
jgi:cyclopropane fatty-acyl-phospholipid synthase-like methyltransferase